MTNDDLRALADALDRIARTHAMIAPDESETQHRAADYLRAQADAQPVGILTVSRFRGHLENYSFDYTGELPEGSHPLYSRMTI